MGGKNGRQGKAESFLHDGTLNIIAKRAANRVTIEEQEDRQRASVHHGHDRGNSECLLHGQKHLAAWQNQVKRAHFWERNEARSKHVAASAPNKKTLCGKHKRPVRWDRGGWRRGRASTSLNLQRTSQCSEAVHKERALTWRDSGKLKRGAVGKTRPLRRKHIRRATCRRARRPRAPKRQVSRNMLRVWCAGEETSPAASVGPQGPRPCRQRVQWARGSGSGN